MKTAIVHLLDITELAIQPHPIHGGKRPHRMFLKVEIGSNFEFEVPSSPRRHDIGSKFNNVVDHQGIG